MRIEVEDAMGGQYGRKVYLVSGTRDLRAVNGDGAHAKKAEKHVKAQLSTSDNVAETMSDLAKAMNQGDFF